MNEDHKYDNPMLRERAELWAREALGKTITVRLARSKQLSAASRMVTGAIVEARFYRFRFTGMKQRVVWQVVVEAGANKTRHVVHVDRLPRN
jgi:hypothetical protein